ncbi:MAG: hemerythrin family protein [Spirochaetes bacterium]|nr:hemerythrin family protein [Spirochaetota bacterium]
MSMFVWSSKWSIDNGEIDRQHMKLVSLIAELQNIHDTISGEELNETVRFLSDYVRIHFSCEENFMISVKYPYLEEHRILHKEFSEYIQSLCDNENIRGIIDIREVLSFLKSWLKDHICREDIKIFQFLKNQENPHET